MKSARRAYRSPLRAQQSADSRKRIIDAAAEGTTPDNLEQLTFDEVARRAKVSVRTVFRHFATQRELHEAVIERFVRVSGWPDDTFPATELPAIVVRFFSSLKRARKSAPKTGLVHTHRAQRYASIRKALEPLTRGMSRADASGVAGVFQVLGSMDTYRKLGENWDLDGAQAGEAVAWAMRTLLAELERRERRRR